MAKHRKEYYMENVTDFAFKTNFSGDADSNGQRHFEVELFDEDFINELKEDGLPVKVWVPKQESKRFDHGPVTYVKIIANYKRDEKGQLMFGPKIHYIDSNNCILSDVGEEDIAELDGANIKRFDICFVGQPYMTRSGEWKKTIYLREMWVELEGNRYANKYRRKDESVAPSVPMEPVDSEDVPF